MKKVLILCGHEPSLDPRIDWAAEAAHKAGYEVRVHGFTIGVVEPKFADREGFETSRGRAETVASKDPEFLKLLLGLKLFPLWILGLAGAVLALVRVILVVRSVSIQAYNALDRVAVFKPVTWVFRTLMGGLYRAVKGAVDRLTDHYPRRLIEGLVGYRWYFNELILKQAVAVWRMFEAENYRPDIIHANDPDCLLAAVVLKKLYGARLIYDAHEYGPEAYLIFPEPKLLFFAYEGLMMRHVDGAVTVTPQIAAKFNQRYRSKPPFHVLPNATPNPKNLKPLDDPFMAATAKGRVRVLFQGGLAAHRGVEELIIAWKNLNPANGVLYIRGPENAFREGLIGHAKATGLLGQSIFFLPSIAEADLTASCLNADIGVISYLSKIENHHGACPNKLSQYMQAGLMVVATNLPFVASVLKASGAGIVFDDKVSGAFEAALLTALTGADLRRSCGQKAKSYAVTHFHYETFWPTIKALYEAEPVPEIEMDKAVAQVSEFVRDKQQERPELEPFLDALSMIDGVFDQKSGPAIQHILKKGLMFVAQEDYDLGQDFERKGEFGMASVAYRRAFRRGHELAGGAYDRVFVAQFSGLKFDYTGLKSRAEAAAKARQNRRLNITDRVLGRG